MQVLIGARTNSTRVPDKNFRPFHARQSLFDVKARQLLDEGVAASTVWVSCEDEAKREQVEYYGFNFLLRDPFLTTRDGERDLLRALVRTVPVDDEIALVSVTDPFFTEFAPAFRTWARVKDRRDSLMVVRPCTDQLLTSEGSPVNFDYFGQPTQCLKGLVTISMCLLIAHRSTVEHCGHFIGRNPHLFTTRDPGVDIDTLDDFRLARAVYEARHDPSNHRSPGDDPTRE